MNSLRMKLAGATALLAISGCVSQPAAEPVELLGVACSSPPPMHCPDVDCPAELIASPGNATDPKTDRKYFLDYPCDLKPGENVTFVLNLHGGGSIGNWERHYFPIMDFKDQYRLVIATPTGPGGIWNGERDDPHLRNIVEQVETAVGKDNISSFWLAGHSFGGQTSNRLIVNDAFFTERVDGWVSLSGGRLGSKRSDVRAPIPRGTPPPPASTDAPPPAARPAGPPSRPAMIDAAVLPAKPFTFIYEAGEHEWTEAGVPESSTWAQKLGCDATRTEREIRDTKPGYVYDTRDQPNRNKIWGMDPRPGVARIWEYPNCDDGRIVADISRIDKGHTEGLEPAITEEIIKMMMRAT